MPQRSSLESSAPLSPGLRAFSFGGGSADHYTSDSADSTTSSASTEDGLGQRQTTTALTSAMAEYISELQGPGAEEAAAPDVFMRHKAPDQFCSNAMWVLEHCSADRGILRTCGGRGSSLHS